MCRWHTTEHENGGSAEKISKAGQSLWYKHSW